MYNNAKTSKRFLAYFIDLIIINLISSFILSFIKPYTTATNEFYDILERYLNTMFITKSDISILLNDYLIMSVINSILLFILIILYFIVLPYFWENQTIGRTILHLQVVDNLEEKPSILQFILREIVGGLFILNMLSFLIIIPILYWYYSVNRGLTLSDMISKTRLIDKDSVNSDKENVINASYEDVNEQKTEETDYKVF